MQRRVCKTVAVGNVPLGGTAPIAVQSMGNVPSHDVEGTVNQARKLQQAGCDILRIAVPDLEAVRLIDAVKSAVDMPLVADIHFDYRLALESVAAGVDKIRINPGNIGSEDHVHQVAKACAAHGVPIRIGVNSGSLEQDILKQYGHPCAEAMRDSALYHAGLLEKYDFDDIVISIKSSRVETMVQAYQLTAAACAYPLHLGVTEAGTEQMGVMKSAIGIGSLLLQGIGDTIRVSLTADPVKEVEAGRRILSALNLLEGEPTLVSCPTCGRTRIDLIGIAAQVEERLKAIHKPVRVAVMGCVVNGPGEAREADIGIAGGDGKVALFKKGQVIRTVPETEAVEELIKEVELL